MRPLARVLIDESHRQAWSTRPEVAAVMNPVNPADASYATASAAAARAGLEITVHATGPIDADTLADVDALVLPHAADDAWEHTTGTGSPRLTAAELDAIEEFVRAGGGLLILAETEQAKYGNNFADLAARFGIVIENTTVQDPTHAHKDVPTWVLADLVHGPRHDLTARVTGACFYRAGSLSGIATADLDELQLVARTSENADPARAGLIMASTIATGRVVVAADSDLFGDDSITELDHRQLWLNLLTWTAGSRAARATDATHAAPWPATDATWAQLDGAVEALRVLQSKDGSIDLSSHSGSEAAALVGRACDAIATLSPRFPHQRDHLAATVTDLRGWADGGFGVPDFAESLRAFRPDLRREDGIEHLAVFPMYTQNGNPKRNFEAVVTRTFWPAWLAMQEADAYGNAAFVPIEFVAFTKGYDTHSAVFFPETVATGETIDFHWGGIFCDREAARFRVVARAAADTLRLSLPPEVDLLLNDQQLAKETFVLWDLIHDRTHSRGDLPFDPFMIKQRMPFWMYALEELRCDLATYRETLALDDAGVHLGAFIRHAIVFDRLFRFTITGDRVRNYDGLGGQIIFAWLHRDDVLRWTDNTLSIDWDRITDSMVALCDQVEGLYRGGIDRSRLAQWLAAHAFVSGLVEPNPASVWAKGASALPLDGEPKELVDVVLPDEFPLNVFYDALRRKLGPTIDATAGITA
jgi:hypothetical protein